MSQAQAKEEAEAALRRDWDCPSRPRDKREKVDRNLFEIASIRDKERPT